MNRPMARASRNLLGTADQVRISVDSRPGCALSVSSEDAALPVVQRLRQVVPGNSRRVGQAPVLVSAATADCGRLLRS